MTLARRAAIEAEIASVRAMMKHSRRRLARTRLMLAGVALVARAVRPPPGGRSAPSEALLRSVAGRLTGRRRS